ncbi:MAG: FGGY family carbohydrate kinase [Oscillospiraceae bacterium]|nr:FGGY family carbohydrate kinase [Oscillospiraceae bacterium]
MIPEYLMYKLCGVKAKEFTNATTMGLVNADTLEIDREIVNRLGLPAHLFPKLQQPGTVIGEYGGISVMLCATHDTGSAVEGIPMEGEALYLSSGTWSLLGVKTPKPLTDAGSRNANYSNEGGVGYNRYQKNIMGMWLVNELRRELEENTGESCKKLYIVGGGAKNAFLNRLTEEATGKQVVALPIEATALGNLKIQLEENQ